MSRGRPREPNSQRSIARRNGISQPAVHHMIRRGRIDPSQPAPIVDQMLKSNADLRQTLRGLGIEHVPESYAEAQTALEQLKVQERAIKLRQLDGALVDRADVNREFYSLGKRLREVWEQWPVRVSSEMANRLGVKPHLMQEVLTKFVKANLGSIMQAEVLRLRAAEAAGGDGDGGGAA